MSKAAKISPRLVEILVEDLNEARENLEARESIWKRLVEDRVLEVVSVGRTATGRPGPGEEIREVRFYPDEWMFRVFYGAEGTQPIRVPFDSINLPAPEVRAQVEWWHAEYEEEQRKREIAERIRVLREAYSNVRFSPSLPTPRAENGRQYFWELTDLFINGVPYREWLREARGQR